MLVVVLALDGGVASAINGLADMFWIAERAQSSSGNHPDHGVQENIPPLDVRIVSVDGNAIVDARGRRLEVDAAIADVERCDAALVPGMALDADGLPPRSPATRRASEWLRQQHARGALIGGSCAGVFVLGDAGLLDKRPCTTTWWLHNELKRRFPDADVLWAAALQDQDAVMTVGGPLSWIHLALHTIRRLIGIEASRLVADFSVIDGDPRPQSIYAPRDFMHTGDPFLLAAEQVVRQAPLGFTAVDLANSLSTSGRTLHRRLHAVTGESPKAFITRIRIETARALLEKPGASVKAAAHLSGYGDDASFRRAFTRQMGLTPTEFRQRAKSRRDWAGLGK